MNLINELQEDILNNSSDLSSILRKAKVLAYTLKNEEMKVWTTNELNGYSGKNKLPDYRRFNAVNRGTFIGPFGHKLMNVQIPLVGTPDDFRQHIEKFYLRQGVKSIESAVRSGDKTFKYYWPSNMTTYYSNNFCDDCEYAEVWQEVSVELLEQVLDIIRTRLLDFIFELREKYPDIQESPDNITKISKNESLNIFHNCIFKEECSISSFDNFQIVQQHVQKDDLSSLLKYLEVIGIPLSELNNLEVAIKNDKCEEEKKTIGLNVHAWFSSFSQKLFPGAISKATDISFDLISKALLAYYGWN